MSDPVTGPPGSESDATTNATATSATSSDYPSVEEAYAMAFGGGATGVPLANTGALPASGVDPIASYAVTDPPTTSYAHAPPPSSYATRPSYGDSRTCDTCGLPGHIAKFCPETMVCRKCGGSGHDQRSCPDAGRVRVGEDENDTIYIEGLPTTITDEDLIAFFGSIGLVRMQAGKGKDRFQKKAKIWIYRDKTTGQPKGDATFSYEDPHSAPAAVKWFDGKEYKGNILKVSLAKRNKEPEAAPSYGGVPSSSSSSSYGSSDRGGYGGGGGGGGYGGGRGGYQGGGGGYEDRGGFRGGRGGFGGGRGGGGVGAANPGDWICPTCSNTCWARRTECNRCNTPNPNPEAAAAAARGGRGGFSDRGGRGGYQGGGGRGGYGGDRGGYGGGGDRYGSSDRGGSSYGGGDRGGYDRDRYGGSSGGGGGDRYPRDDRRERDSDRDERRRQGY